MEDLYDKLLIELECPVCSNYMKPPIRLCATGHSICQTCRNKLPNCPLCQGTFTDSKNISLEALASKMHYPCTNKERGCILKFAMDEIESHEKICSFRGFECAMKKCHWSGNVQGLIEHWISKPGMNNKLYTKSNVCHVKLKSDSYYVNILQAHGQVFWFKQKFDKASLFWAFQLIGDKDDAKKYFYTIQIIKPGASHLSITYTDCCKSIVISNNDLLKKNVCISVGVDHLQRFIGDDQVLIYYLKVYEDKEGSGKQNDAAGPSKNQVKNVPKPPYTLI